MPSTDGLVHYDLGQVGQANSEASGAFAGAVKGATSGTHIDPFSAAITADDTGFSTRSSGDKARLGSLIQSLQTKNSNSANTVMTADGDNTTDMNAVTV